MDNNQLSAEGSELLRFYKAYWQLTENGVPFHTRTSYLQSVQFNGAPAMLKIATVEEEYRGGQLMVWWKGDGAARVLAQYKNALLLERATGSQSLSEMAHHGQDKEASRILCDVTTRLHAHRKQPPVDLHPLSQWYQPLLQNAPVYGEVFVKSAAITTKLFATPQDITVLHGDIHHANVMDFGSRGWLAIDPKGLLGERTFDFANIFCNPNHAVATAPGRLLQQIEVISQAAHLNPDRLLAWVASWAGLSAMWSIGVGEDPDIALTTAQVALEELRGSEF